MPDSNKGAQRVSSRKVRSLLTGAFAALLIVTAMTQLRRWGPDGAIFGDMPEWAAAREAVVVLMERYARGR